MTFRRFLPALLLAAAPSLASAQSAPATPKPRPAQLPADSMQIGRKYIKWLYDNEADSLVAHMDEESRNKPDARTQVQQTMLQIATRLGTETDVVEEKYITRNGIRQFWHIAKFSAFGEPVALRWVISSKGEIMGFGMNPLSKVPDIDP